MNVKDLQGSGLFVPYDKIPEDLVFEVKCRIMDSLLAMIGGALSMSEDEQKAISGLAQEKGDVRTVWPDNISTNLEMAGFINAYYMRYADWGDTYRRAGGIGGHASDQLAAVFALASLPGVDGRKIIELSNMAYVTFSALQENMMYHRQEIDYTSTMSLTVPMLAAACFGASPERTKDAVYISAAGGTILEQVRTGGTTNLKNAASAYSVARGLWCYRLSEAIHAPDSIFDGKYGWYNVHMPMDKELKGEGAEAYKGLEIKVYSCFNGAQAAAECMVKLHDKVADKLDDIEKIDIKVSAVDARVCIRPGQNPHPSSQADADHNAKYCSAIALQHGALTPMHYTKEHLENATTLHLIDMMDMVKMSDEEAAALNNGDGACIVKITMKDGSTYDYSIEAAAGVLTGVPTEERQQRLLAIVDSKIKMAESAGGLDLSKVRDIVLNLEKYEGGQFLDAVQEALRK